MARSLLLGSWAFALLTAATADAAGPNARHSADQLTFHGNARRTGWYDDERQLSPARLRSGRFGLLWESAPLPAAGNTPARLLASPLYVQGVRIDAGGGHPARHDVVFAASATGAVAAIAADSTREVPAGATLWSTRVTSAPCARGTLGILGTPVIDRSAARLYVVACDTEHAWQLHALLLADGREAPGWPLELGPRTINAPGINVNGANQFPGGVVGVQRGALALDAKRGRLYITFGGEPLSGWLLQVDPLRIRVSSAFSITPRTEEGNGGLWSSGGAAIDDDGDVYVASGSSVINALAGKGNAGVYPDSEGNWGQSILRIAADSDGRLRLAGSYTPYNYCQSGGQDIDLGSSTPMLFDLPGGASATPRLLVQGGSKQGNAYLLDRKHLPGGLVRRAPCASGAPADAAHDASLLGPGIQPQFGTPGPLNVFGPYTERHGMGDLARSRSTPAYFADAGGRYFVFAAGTTKAAEDSPVSVPPSLVRLEVVAQRGRPAYLRVDAVQPQLALQNPGAPVVSSRGHRDAVVWVLDVNRPRSASLYGEDPPQPALYALDAATLELLWRSEPGELHAGGKYNEPVVTRGRVFVGTDRIQAYGLRDRASPAMSPRSPAAPPPPAAAPPPPAAAPSTAPAQATPQPPAPGSAAAPPPAPADGTAGRRAGERTGRQRDLCGALRSCHEQQRADIPARSLIEQRSPAFIVDKLLYGSMQVNALGLSDAQVEALARWLGHGTSGSLSRRRSPRAPVRAVQACRHPAVLRARLRGRAASGRCAAPPRAAGRSAAPARHRGG
ncbi:MAG: hypothetical protein U1F11_05395 [Steroidobacteraceae bacterium]